MTSEIGYLAPNRLVAANSRIQGELALVTTALSACGGGEGQGGAGTATSVTWNPDGTSLNPEILAEQIAEFGVNFEGVKTYPKELPKRSAARFLNQATFGATHQDIDIVSIKWRSQWIDDQITMLPQSTHYDDVLRYQRTMSSIEGSWDQHIWESYVTSPDQLRKRIGFALSQIFVINVQGQIGGGGDRALLGAAFFDILERGAFGNFRDLLEEVTLSPAMGYFLSSLNNNKALYNTDMVAIRVPDENYAREVMQLFTIGTIYLNIDGSPKLYNGLPKETYNNTDIQNLARVFTGWRIDSASSGIARWKRRMWLDPSRHSPEEKKFLSVTIKAGTSGLDSLKIALDTLFNHPNVAPFICHKLIQRLITSNPSPDYIERVARIFNNDGDGVRGNLKAVIKSILTDPEAINPKNLDAPALTWGKLREPVLRFTHLLRILDTRTTDPAGIWSITWANALIGQHPGRAPSVFNFFDPQYSPNTPAFQTQKLVAPELQIANEVSVVTIVNYFSSILNSPPGKLTFSFDRYLSLSDSPDLLIDSLNLTLLNETLSVATRKIILDTLLMLPKSSLGIQYALLRVKAAILMMIASPEYIVQK